MALAPLDWIMAKAISKLVLVISSTDTREVLERWAFDIVLEEPAEKQTTGQTVGQKYGRA